MADEMMDERFIGNDSGFVVSLVFPSRYSKRSDVECLDGSIRVIAMHLVLSQFVSIR